MWCLIGCAAGDMGTVFVFQNIDHSLSVAFVFMLAMMQRPDCQHLSGDFYSVFVAHGIFTALCGRRWDELYLHVGDGDDDEPCRLLGDRRCALNFAERAVDVDAGFLTPLPYNYWRLKKYGKACH